MRWRCLKDSHTYLLWPLWTPGDALWTYTCTCNIPMMCQQDPLPIPQYFLHSIASKCPDLEPNIGRIHLAYLSNPWSALATCSTGSATELRVAYDNQRIPENAGDHGRPENQLRQGQCHRTMASTPTTMLCPSLHWIQQLLLKVYWALLPNLTSTDSVNHKGYPLCVVNHRQDILQEI
jgi:hypothetical protein